MKLVLLDLRSVTRVSSVTGLSQTWSSRVPRGYPQGGSWADAAILSPEILSLQGDMVLSIAADK